MKFLLYDSRGPALYEPHRLRRAYGNAFDAPCTGSPARITQHATHISRWDRFTSTGGVIDVRNKLGKLRLPVLTQGVVKNGSGSTAAFPGAALVLIRTDWSKNAGAKPSSHRGPPARHSRGFHSLAVLRFLARERNILASASTVGTDAGQGRDSSRFFPCHTIMHGANVSGLASLTTSIKAAAVRRGGDRAR